ncbi:hypothetical protein B0H66DRAFT_371918 [Apodospora peruviana]|uniref:Uncharacterized protein n=1 Tax=Apodospora peruviana TaxID=516989 RepID=A0AAE0M080_9PEZI|nr:hypothetical protein B0H66DRAFT_371918 [Apodospora peruviana]
MIGTRWKRERSERKTGSKRGERISGRRYYSFETGSRTIKGTGRRGKLCDDCKGSSGHLGFALCLVGDARRVARFQVFPGPGWGPEGGTNRHGQDSHEQPGLTRGTGSRCLASKQTVPEHGCDGCNRRLEGVMLSNEMGLTQVGPKQRREKIAIKLVTRQTLCAGGRGEWRCCIARVDAGKRVSTLDAGVEGR